MKSPLNAIPMALVSLSLLAACTSPDTVPPNRPPTPDELAEATYVGIFDDPVTLTEGEFEGEPIVEGGAARPRVTLVEGYSGELVGMGDLNGDGVDDAAVLLAATTGGTGENLYLAVVVGGPDGPENVAVALVGDRVEIRDLTVTGGAVHLGVLQVGEEDAMCCPGDLARRTWQLRDDSLVETATDITRRLSLESVAGVEWTLTHLGRNEPAPAEPVVTLTFDAAGTCGGASGCNRFSGAVEQFGPVGVTFGPLRVTMMACDPPALELEQAFLARLGAVNKAGFHLGRLALTWQADGEFGMLLFEARPAPD